MKNAHLEDNKLDFATEHHNLIYTFLKNKGLSFDAYYDIVVFGYLRAVKIYFEKSHLQKNAFSTIA